MMNVLAYADGDHDLLAIADRIDVGFHECASIAKALHAEDLLEIVDV